MIIKPDDNDKVVILTGKDAQDYLNSKRSAVEMDVSTDTSSDTSSDKTQNKGQNKGDGKRKKVTKDSLDKDSCDLEGAKKVIDDYIQSDETSCIEISDISKADRHQLHIYAAIKGLDHWSSGSDSSRVMSIQKK